MHLRALLLFLFVSTAAAQSDGTALDALKLIPKDAAKRLARIEAHDGSPVPERWHLLVHDPAEERGVREYVVAGGKLAASRTLSQFAEALKPADVFGAGAVKIDSAQVARLAAAFAEANGAKAASLNYELARDATAGVPVWKVTVLDAVGDQLGVLAVNAVKGAVLSSEGFEKTPAGVVPAMPVAPLPPAPVASDVRPVPAQRSKATPTPRANIPTPRPNILKRIFGGGSDSSKSER